MNRDHAIALLANLPLLQHFAAGGDVAFRLHDYKGEYIKTVPTGKIILGNLTADGSHGYVRLKPRFRVDSTTGMWMRCERCKLDSVAESDVLKD